MNCTVWTTKSCNLRCKYCYEKENSETGHMHKDIEDKVLTKILNDIIDSKDNFHYIQFHGGEPLLNYKVIKRYINEINKVVDISNVKFSLTTNGTVWNDEIRNLFKKYKNQFAGSISISIDGDEYNNDLNRIYYNGEGSFSKVSEIAKELLIIYPDIRCRVTVAPNTVSNLFNNIIYLINMGFKEISVVFDFFSNDWNESHIDIIEQQYKQIYEAWIKYHKDVEISIIHELSYKKKALSKCVPSINYYIDGEIYPCAFVVGNTNLSIGNIFNGVNLEKYNEIVKLSGKCNNLCLKCSNNESCISNRCKLQNMLITDDYFIPPTISCVLENIKQRVSDEIKLELNVI